MIDFFIAILLSQIYTRAFTKLDSYLINELPEDFAHIDMIIDGEKGVASVPGTIIIESKALTALRRHLITVKLMLKRYQKLRRNLSSEGSKSDVIPVKNFGKSLVLKILELHHLAENVEPHTNK